SRRWPQIHHQNFLPTLHQSRPRGRLRPCLRSISAALRRVNVAMLPAHLAENIRKQVLFYLQSTFDFRDKEVDKAFERFLTDPENGLFKGPWAQLRRPFRPADAHETLPFDFKVEFHPFKHQNRSWRRLSSKLQQPKPS